MYAGSCAGSCAQGDLFASMHQQLSQSLERPARLKKACPNVIAAASLESWSSLKLFSRAGPAGPRAAVGTQLGWQTGGAPSGCARHDKNTLRVLAGREQSLPV